MAGADQTLTLLSSERRVRVLRDGLSVADTDRAVLVLTSGPGPRRPPVYAIPRDDVATERLIADDHGRCPLAGPFTTFALAGPFGRLPDAGLVYDSPPPPHETLADRVLFAWDAADSWWEEDVQIFGHPTDPFHRVDAIQARRHVTVHLDDQVLADSWRPTMVFETGRPARAYLPGGDVRMDLLTPSAHRSRCPVKGIARYWDVRRGAEPVRDVAWSYPFPVAQLPAIAQLICFDPDHVEVRHHDDGPRGR